MIVQSKWLLVFNSNTYAMAPILYSLNINKGNQESVKTTLEQMKKNWNFWRSGAIVTWWIFITQISAAVIYFLKFILIFVMKLQKQETILQETVEQNLDFMEIIWLCK